MNIFVADIAMARRYAYISDAKARFLERIWPGPVTMIFHHKEKLPKAMTGGLDTIGLRIPDNPSLVKLLLSLDVPIAVTDDETLHGNSSTVIDFTGAAPVILRAGMVTKEELAELFKTVIE